MPLTCLLVCCSIEPPSWFTFSVSSSTSSVVAASCLLRMPSASAPPAARIARTKAAPPTRVARSWRFSSSAIQPWTPSMRSSMFLGFAGGLGSVFSSGFVSTFVSVVGSTFVSASDSSSDAGFFCSSLGFRSAIARILDCAPSHPTHPNLTYPSRTAPHLKETPRCPKQ